MTAGPFAPPPGMFGAALRNGQWVRTVELPPDADASGFRMVRGTPDALVDCGHGWLRVTVPRWWRRRWTWTCVTCGARWTVERRR